MLLLAFPHPAGGPAPRRAISRDGLVLGLGAPVFGAPLRDLRLKARHAEIGLLGGRAFLRDLGGGAGTRLNGVAVRGQAALADGDVIRLGDTLVLFTAAGEAAPGAGEPVDGPPGLTGETPSIQAVRRSIAAVAPRRRTVVITGETGTGKEIVARQIHERSGRGGPFLAVNCGGFSEGLLASELFGHLRGAFTGAVAEAQGLFRAARGGTLLLDEASDLPLPLQGVLLRVLETWEVRPVGSARDVAVDVRVVAASNRELVGLVQRGLFRADLYARLAQWIIRLPPLRERRQDIPALCRALLARLEERGRPMSPDLEEALLIHPWPLNVRGLSNVLAIASIATPEDEPLQLGPEVRSALQDNLVDRAAPQEAPRPGALDRPALEALLSRFGGRVAAMARQAGVSRPRMYRLLWAAGLEPASFRRGPSPASAAGAAPRPA